MNFYLYSENEDPYSDQYTCTVQSLKNLKTLQGLTSLDPYDWTPYFRSTVPNPFPEKRSSFVRHLRYLERVPIGIIWVPIGTKRVPRYYLGTICTNTLGKLQS